MKDREYHKTYSRNYYHKRKQFLLDLLGNQCVECGSFRKLEFDHINPTTKLFPISKLLNYKWAMVLDEVKKCQLLCCDCHILKTKLNEDGYNSRASGESIASSKLTLDQVTEIKWMQQQSIPYRKIVKAFPHVTKATVYNVLNRVTWKDIGEVAERLKAPALKADDYHGPRVQIPVSPPSTALTGSSY